MKPLFGFVAALFLFLQPALATEVREVVTPGGFKAWLVEEHSVPLLAVRIAFKESGYAHDKPGLEGRSNMVAALLGEGAGDLDSRAFNEALEAHAIELTSSADEDQIDVLLETLSEHKDKAFSYLGMALAKPRFDSSAIDRVKSQSLAWLVQKEQEPGYALQRAWQKLAYGDHPYGRAQIGTESGIRALDHGDLATFAKKHLTKENIIIAAVGDISPEELSRLLDAYLAELPQRFEPDVTVPEFTLPAGSNEPVIIAFDIPQTMVMFGANGLKRRDPDYFAAYVMNHLLGGGGSLTARLGEEIREKRGLAYSVYSGLNPMRHAASWHGGFATRNDQAHAALDVLRATLRTFVDQGPGAKELADAKRYVMDSFVLNLDSNAEIAAFLINMQINELGIDYFNRRNALVEAVRKEDVHAMARRLIDPDKLLVAMVGKTGKN